MLGNARRSAFLADNLGKGEVRSSILRCSTSFPSLFAAFWRVNHAWPRIVARCVVADLSQCLFPMGSRR